MYAFVFNESINNVDPLGNKILSLNVLGSGSTSGFASSDDWRRALIPNKAEKIGSGTNLGYHGGSYKDYGADGGLISGLIGVLTGGTKMSLGMYKFAVTTEWTVGRTTAETPDFRQFVSGVKRKIKYKDGTELDLGSFSEERDDGPTWEGVRTLHFSKDRLKELRNKKLVHWYIDAPLIGVEACEEGTVEFEATWRIVLEEKSRIANKATAKIKIKFSFNTETPETPTHQEFVVIEHPTIQ